jgi:hypothetical protein
MAQRIRGARVVVAGMCVVLAPLLASESRAGAAQTGATGTSSLTYVDDNGVAVTCSIEDDAFHNNDNANQPFTSLTSGESGDVNDCLNTALLTVTVSYKDRGGIQRTVTTSSFSTTNIVVQGTYSAIATSVRAQFFRCDSSRSATCEVTAFANPK